MLVAWLALALSVANIAWSVWSWVRTGPRVLVIADVGWTDMLGMGDVIARVIVYNAGRTAISLYEVGFLAPDGQSIVVWGNDPDGVPMRGEPTPERLEPNSRCARPYKFDVPSLQALCERTDSLVVGLVPYAKLGDRSRVRGHWESDEAAERLGPHYADD